MDQLKNNVEKQVMYLGRWVNREHFRAFVYRKSEGNTIELKLAESYAEFESLIASGTWFDSTESIPKMGIEKTRKSKHGVTKSEC